MAGYTIDKDGNVINAGGIDVGYLAATQPSLLSDGIDTEDEILDWYASYGQMAGAPANYNEQLARDDGYQGNFTGNGTWDTQVQDFYADGLSIAGQQSPQVYVSDRGWVDRADVEGSYGPAAYAPESEVWLGGEALDNGWVYKSVVGSSNLISDDAGGKVLGGDEVYWDPDVKGSAAGAGIMDHRLVTQHGSNIRTADSNYDVNQTVRWGTFKDAPYNNFSNFDAFVKKKMGEGIWGGEDYTPEERDLLAAGDNFGLGFKETITGRTKKIGGYELTADQWARDAGKTAKRHVAGIKNTQMDPGYVTGGSWGLAGLEGPRTLDFSAWGDNPNLDKYAIDGGPWSIGYRQDINRLLGRPDMPVTPSDHQAYINELQRQNGPANPRSDEELADYIANWRERRGRDEDDDEPVVTPPSTPRPERPRKETNPGMSIFTNASVGYPDPDLFTFR